MRRRLFIGVILFALTLGVVIVPPFRRVFSPVAILTTPVEVGMASVQVWLREWMFQLLGGSDVARLRDIEQAFAADGVDRARLALLEAENLKLKEQLELKESQPWSFVSAHVIGQDPRDLRGLLRLSVGERQGVRRGAAVLTANGVLVGVLVDVGQDVSSVRLLRSPGVSLLGKVAGKETVFGIVESPDGLTVRFTQVPKGESLDVGDVVVTNLGFLGVPPDIPLGTVVEVTGNPEDLWQEAVIAPFAAMSTLRIVSVVLP